MASEQALTLSFFHPVALLWAKKCLRENPSSLQKHHLKICSQVMLSISQILWAFRSFFIII